MECIDILSSEEVAFKGFNAIRWVIRLAIVARPAGQDREKNRVIGFETLDCVSDLFDVSCTYSEARSCESKRMTFNMAQGVLPSCPITRG